jgi:hypothetical protein
MRQQQEDSMTSLKFLGATLVLSALLATPASAWDAVSEPAAAAAADPTFSIYSNDGPSYPHAMAQVPLNEVPRPYMSIPPHRRHHAAAVRRY